MNKEKNKFIVFNTYKKAEHYIRYQNVVAKNPTGKFYIDYFKGTVVKHSDSKNEVVGRIKEAKKHSV